jgi:hypothetical protein
MRFRAAEFFVYSALRPRNNFNLKELTGLQGLFKRHFPRLYVFLLLAAGGLQIFGCGTASGPPGDDDLKNHQAPARVQNETRAPEGHDLSRDEQRGGHTLARHVARTDDELRERLARERNISAASTWIDRETAETVVGEALTAERGRVDTWMRRGFPRANLALHYNAGRAIGRSLRRGESQTVECTSAVVVLRADGPDGFYVLTTYPEARK